MAELKARFSLIDEMSEKLVSMAEAGQNMIGQWENANSTISSAMDNAASGASNVISSLANAADSLNGINSAANNALSGTENFSKSIGDLENSMDSAVQTTEQFAEAGAKTSESLMSENDIMAKCEQMIGKLSSESSKALNVHNDLSNSFAHASQTMSKYASSGELSSAAQRKLSESSRKAGVALANLGDVQESAKKAVEYYNSVLKSGTEDTKAFEIAQSRLESALKHAESAQNKAQEAVDKYNSAVESSVPDLNSFEVEQNRVSQAANNFTSSNREACEAVEKLSGASQEAENKLKEYENELKRAGRESEKFGDGSKKSVSSLESVLAGAGIVAGLKKIADEFMECSESAAQFESSIAKVSTIADTSSVPLMKISDDIMSLSKASGKSANDLTEATYQAISASVDTANAVKFVNEANKLATGGFTQQATAADVLTTAINAYGLAVSDASKVSDMLITTQNLGKTSVDELASNMGRVIPLAAAYNVEMDNLSAGYAQLTKNGIATAESTTYMKAMLNELGDTSKTVSKILTEETGQSFAQLMQSGYSLADVLEIIGDSVNGDTTAFNNLWGSQEAGIGALALYNAGAEEFNRTLDAMRDSAGAASTAYATMANTTEHAKERMDNAFSNLKITIGSQLNPVISDLYNNIADVTDKISDFISKNPAVTAALTGLAVTLWTGAAALTAYTLASKVATVATEAFTVACDTNPILLAISAVAALTAGIVAMVSVIKSSMDTIEDYNGTLEQCSEEIQNTETAYKNVCETYGENSDAAKRLKDELDTLHAQYEKGGGVVADYTQRLEESRQTLDSFQSDYSNKMKEIDDSWQNGMIATAQLEAISKKTELTNADLDMMGRYADYLNDTFNCNIEVNYDTGELTGFDPANINDIMSKVAAENRKQAAMDSITGVDFTSKYIDEVKKLNDLKSEFKTAKTEIEKAAADPSYVNTSGRNWMDEYKELSGLIEESESIITSYNDTIHEAYSDMGVSYQAADGYIEALGNMSNGFNDVAEAAEKANEALTPQETAAYVYSQYQEQIEELAEAYDKARESIRSSLDDMFGLFEEAKMNLENSLSMDSAISNLESQIDYFNQYKEAAEQLANIGIDNDIISQLDPEQAVKFANELSGMDSASAAAKVGELNKAFGELSKVKDETSSSLADIQEEYTKKMDEINQNMIKDVEKLAETMDISEGAKTSAENTLNAYIEQIKKGGESAVSAVQDIANRISNSFASASAKMDMSISVTDNVPKKGYATGTISAAPGLAFVGENGPEIIDFKGGERVYNSSETNGILSALLNAKNESYDNSISYLTNESSAEYSTVNNSQSTEIVNNYSSVLGGSYDDTRVISLLERMENTFSALGNKIGSSDTSYTAPETSKVEPYEIIVDLSVLDSMISRLNYNNEVSSYDESVTYGDTQNVDNSRSYSAEYGDTVSNFNDTVIEYGDTIRSATENINNVDNSGIYGDDVSNSVSSYTDNVTRYGDNIKRFENTESSEVSNIFDNDYNADYGRQSQSTFSYSNDVVRNIYDTSNSVDNSFTSPESTVYGNTFDSNIEYGDVIKRSEANYSLNDSRYNSAVTNYGDTIRNATENAYSTFESNNYKGGNSDVNNVTETLENYNTSMNAVQSHSDGVESVIMILPIKDLSQIESLTKGVQGAFETYYNNSVDNTTIAEEIYRTDSTIESSEFTNSERIVAADKDRFNPSESDGDSNETVSRKEIDLNINGNGKITVSGGMNEDDIFEFILERFKPVLKSIIAAEVLEEGDSSYEY